MSLQESLVTKGNEKYNGLPVNDKVQALDLSLQQATANFRDLVVEFQELKIQSELYKSQLTRQREEYESKTCDKCAGLQSDIASKENIIQIIASALTRLNDTKNFGIIGEIFKIIFGVTTTLTPPKETESFEKKEIIKLEPLPTTSTPNMDKCATPVSNTGIKEESVSEIESTPTGRISPIIQSKKSKGVKDDSIEAGVKKKCSSNWTTSETKHAKVSYPFASLLKTPKAQGHKVKLRQARLELVKNKTSHVVDLTSSPEVVGSPRNPADDEKTKLKINIKKESLDNEDTILPSPTSGPVRSIFKSTTVKSSPQKFIKPSVFKTEAEEDETMLADNFQQLDTDATRLEHSAELLCYKAPSSPKKGQPREPQNENCSQFDTNVSLSLLQHVAQIEKEVLHGEARRKSNSPPKRPLAENMNALNLPSQDDSEVSISVLHRDPCLTRTPKKEVISNKRRSPEKPEDIFKEPTARTKAEKRALPGWSCEECKNFYGELYRDDHEMLLAKMQECSRHRGKRDPARPKTPPNFWNPRWHVPDDTEAFNRQNNAS